MKKEAIKNESIGSYEAGIFIPKNERLTLSELCSSIGDRNDIRRETFIEWLPKTDSDITSDIDYGERHS